MSHENESKIGSVISHIVDEVGFGFVFAEDFSTNAIISIQVEEGLLKKKTKIHMVHFHKKRKTQNILLIKDFIE